MQFNDQNTLTSIEKSKFISFDERHERNLAQIKIPALQLTPKYAMWKELVR